LITQRTFNLFGVGAPAQELSVRLPLICCWCYFLVIYFVFSNFVNLARTIRQSGKIVGVKKGWYRTNSRLMSGFHGDGRLFSMTPDTFSVIANRVQKRDADSGKAGENFLRLLPEKPGDLG
jgi:hypothetical protein